MSRISCCGMHAPPPTALAEMTFVILGYGSVGNVWGRTYCTNISLIELAVLLIEQSLSSIPSFANSEELKTNTNFYLYLIPLSTAKVDNIMADPVSVAAGFVGIIVPALHGTRLLRENIENITDAPKAVASLKEDLLSVDMALKALEAVESSEWKSLGQAVENQSKFAISTCKTACDAFMEGLRHWTKHSTDGKLTFRDRVNVGFMQKQKMKSLSAQLQNCRSTINAVASIATLYVESLHIFILNDEKF